MLALSFPFCKCDCSKANNRLGSVYFATLSSTSFLVSSFALHLASCLALRRISVTAQHCPRRSLASGCAQGLWLLSRCVGLPLSEICLVFTSTTASANASHFNAWAGLHGQACMSTLGGIEQAWQYFCRSHSSINYLLFNIFFGKSMENR